MNIGRRNSVRLFAAACLLFLSFPSLAQTVLSGKAVEKKGGAPVPGAVVYAYSDKTLAAYAVCAGDGSFSLTVPQGRAADRMTVMCMGYKTESLELEGRKPPLTFEMTEEKLSIKEAKATSSVMEQKGDTLKYVAGAFADGSERAVAELLQKIPGLSVTESGGVLYQGQAINKFYVDGMDLMGAGYGVVIKNLSADKISSVEVYKRHQPVKALAGINPTDRSAVNIILKESAKGTWMFTGDAEVGAPEFLLFDAKLLLSRFAKKSQDLFLIKGNDTGIDILKELSAQRYFGRTGAILVSDESLDADFITPLNPRHSRLPISQEYWYDNLSGIGSFNHLSRLSEDFQVRASLQLAGERYDEASDSKEEVRFDKNESMVISETESLTDVKYYASGKISAEKNSARTFLLDDLQLSAQMRTNESGLDGGRAVYDQHYDLPSFKLENKLDMTVKTRESRTFSVMSRTWYTGNSHEADYSADGLRAHQEYFQKEFKTVNSVSFGRKIGKSLLTLSPGLDFEHQNIDASLTGLSMDGLCTSSALAVSSFVPYVSASLRANIGKTELYASAAGRLYAISGKDISMVYPDFTPMVQVQRVFSPCWKASAHATWDMSRSGLESLLGSYVMGNYRTLSLSDSLARKRMAAAGVAIEYSNDPKFFYASLSASWSANKSEKTATNRYSDDFTVAGFAFNPVESGNMSITGKVSKYFGLKAFVVDLSGGWSRMDQTNYLQEVLREYRTDSWRTEMRLRTNPCSWFSAELNGEYIRNFVQGASGVRTSSFKLSGKVMVKPVKAVTVNTGVDWLKEDVPGMSAANDPLVKMEAVWKIKQMSLVAQCRNMLNCKEFKREYVDAFRTLSTTTTLPGIQFIAGMRLSL